MGPVGRDSIYMGIVLRVLIVVRLRIVLIVRIVRMTFDLRD